MTERTTPWPVGAPAWADLSVTDMDRSTEFYRAVLGWEFTGGGAEFGGYLNATVQGKAVAGIAPPMEGQPEAPHVWTVYLAVEDSLETEKAISAAGGTVVLPSTQVGPFGTMGIYTDSTGAAFGTWQPGTHAGFEVTDVAGSVNWNEAMVADMETGKAFYADVFGWSYQDWDAGEMRYAIVTTPGDESGMTCGMGQVEAGQHPYWSMVFAVEDADAAAQRVRDAGGTVMGEPFDFEFGRLVLCSGPDGEMFALNQPPTQHPQV